jgi:vacuolar-type H+-ATPase subunit I/STV1
MSEQIPPPRTAAALEARRRHTRGKVDQVRTVIAELKRQKVPVTVAAVVRRADVSRTFLYENPDARALVTDAVDRGSATLEPTTPRPDSPSETQWRERALNAEDALKAAHGEIRTQRNRIAQLMGQIRDLETQWTDESIERITTENSNLKQRVRQLTQDKRTFEERLQAARSNSRFQDRRIADLESKLLDAGGFPP